MRITLMLLLFLLSNVLSAQERQQFYDYNWKPSDAYNASFYSKIKKTDSGWRRTDYYLFTKKLQMVGLYEDSACKIKNGNFSYYHANGTLESSGRFIYDKYQGEHLSYYSAGEKKYAADFDDNKLQGVCLYFWRNGVVSDSVFKVSDNLFEWKSQFENGNISAVGNKLSGKLHGEWKFYDMDGKLASVENYDTGHLVSRTYFGINGNAISDTTNTDCEEKFKNGNKDWQNYIANKLYWPDGYHFTKGYNAVVVVKWDINEKGEVENAEVDVPFNPAFDAIAIDIIKKSPRWAPAKSHNRFIKVHRRYAIRFIDIDS